MWTVVWGWDTDKVDNDGVENRAWYSSSMAYIKYGFLAAVLLIVFALVLSTHAKESIQEWRPAVVPENSVIDQENPVVNENFSALPTTGAAPLKVRFSAKVPVAGNYELRFGDGSASLSFTLTEDLCVDGDKFNACGRSLDSVVHIYDSAGDYTAKLYRDTTQVKCVPNTDCSLLGTVMIAVH